MGTGKRVWRGFRISVLALLAAFGAAPACAKFHPTFAIAWAACQPYPYNGLTFSDIYQGNLLSNLSLEWFPFHRLALTAAVGNDVLDWNKDQWKEDPDGLVVLNNVYLNTWHTMGGAKFFPWGEIISDNFWRLEPFLTAEGGQLDLEVISKGTDHVLQYSTSAAMAGIGIGLEVGTPGEEEDSEILRFFSRNLRFLIALKYFVGFTPSSLQYVPLQFGLKIRI